MFNRPKMARMPYSEVTFGKCITSGNYAYKYISKLCNY